MQSFCVTMYFHTSEYISADDVEEGINKVFERYQSKGIMVAIEDVEEIDPYEDEDTQVEGPDEFDYSKEVGWDKFAWPDGDDRNDYDIALLKDMDYPERE